MKVVVDTWVLHQASKGNHDAIEVLDKIYKNCHKVCYDEENKILTEHKSVPGLFVAKWLTLIITRKKIKIKIKKRCKNILGHRKDMKFVYVCLNSSNLNVIISEDHHFINNSDKLLKKGIQLLSLKDALNIL